MKISEKGLSLIKRFEGVRLTAYKPVAAEKYWTIGYGHYGSDVKPGMKITAAQAEAYLRIDIAKFESKVNKYSKYNFTQNQFDALVSFAYNVGSIDGLTANGTRSIAQISAAIPKYNKGSGKVLAGLVKRRAAEKELFDSGATNSPTIKLGARGEAVREAQGLLNAKGYGCGSADGIFGKKTDAAARAFQTDHQLVVDGIIGEKTWKMLRN